MKQLLLNKIENREIVVGVIGLGYVGLPLAVEKAKAGFKTIGFDEQEVKVKMVNEGHNYIGDVVDKDLKRLGKEDFLRPLISALSRMWISSLSAFRPRWTFIRSRILAASESLPNPFPNI